jgi:hypothetical protein
MRPLKISQQKAVRPWSLILDQFEGTATVLDDAILGKKYAKEALNLTQVQDGRWKTRPGRRSYGSTLTGESYFLGVGKYTKTDGTRELIAIGSTTGKAYKSTDGGAWTEITGATFTIAAKNIFFKQINNYLFICNGNDRLTRYNGTVLSRYTALSAPTGLAGVRNVLTAGANHNYYIVTALNDIGETVGSAEIDVTTNKTRDTWIFASNEYLDLSWGAVTGAIKYQIYYSDLSTKEALLGESSTNSYRDDNTDTVNPYVVYPTQDTTGAPKFSMVATSGSRIWGIAPSEFPYRVFYSGTAQYLGYFSDTFGGGYTELDNGGDDVVSFVEHFRTGRGDTAATVFTKSPKGGGSVWQIQLTPNTIGTVTFIVGNPDKIVGSMGANSPGAALLVGDSIMFLGERGINSLTNKANVSNVLSTTPQSRNISPSYLGLNFSKADQFRAYAYQKYILFSATEGAGENDLSFLYDTELDRWYWRWDFGVRGFIEYTENASGTTKLLLVPTSGNQLVECSENISSDFGQPIKTSLLTGLIPISRDQYVFAKVIEALIVLGRPKGTINFEILGLEKKKGFSSISTKTITDTLQSNEFWTGSLGEITLKSEETAPTVYSQASVKKRNRIGKVLNAIQFHVYSNSADTEYTLLSIQAQGVIANMRPPSSWN